MSERIEQILKQHELKRAAEIVRWTDTIMDADPEDLLETAMRVLDLAYSRGYERATIERDALDSEREKTPQSTRLTCPACSRDIEIRAI